MQIRSRALRLTSYGIVPVALHCPADETRCEGELTLTAVRRFTKAELTRHGLQAGQPYELATRAFAFRGGTTLTIRVPLARPARALARALGRFDVRLDLIAYDKAANETTLTRFVTLRAAARRGHTSSHRSLRELDSQMTKRLAAGEEHGTR